ncbi:hypothetical protein MferCBS49748_006778 [Microsporum ferrugineum]
MDPEMPHGMRTPPPNTPEESSEPIVTSTMKTGSSQLPRGVTHPARPDQGASGQELPITMSKAYNYLDLVKAQFIDRPDIYNTFYGILADYKNQVIDIPGVVGRVSKLFAGYPNIIQGFNTFLVPIYRIKCDSSNNPNATGYPSIRNEFTISHINPPKMPATPLNTPTESSEPITPLATHKINTPTSMLSEQLDTGTKTGYQIKYGAGNNINTTCATATDHSAYNALTTQTAQGPDTAKDAESSDLPTRMDPGNTSLPLPQMLVILVQPPELTRQEIELFPPMMVLQPGDMPNFWAIATLRSNGVDITDQLGGERIQSSINGTFRFPGLTIHEQGVYCVRIYLYRIDYDTYLQGVTQVGYVDSNPIIVGSRPDGMAIRRSTAAQDTLWVRQPLLYQTVDANTCIDDHTGYFPNLTIHASSSVITMEQMGQIEYSKYMVFKPVSDFILEAANLEHGLYNFGYGLFMDKGGVWFDDGEIERGESLDGSVLLGDDGELYRKRTGGVFNGLFVGLERRVAIVENGDSIVICIAHNVLIS